MTASGKINLYALFAETFLHLLGPRGRAGPIVPTGIAPDDTTKAFFEEIATRGRLVSLFDFENREAIFDIHRSYKFCLLTLGANVEAAEFVFFATKVEHLEDERRRFALSPEDIRRINPNTRTAPVFRSKADAELTKKICARVPVLLDESKGAAGNPWGVSFRQGLFNMTSDSHLFRTQRELEAAGARPEGVNWIEPSGEVRVPLYEAKMIHQFDHRWASWEPDGKTLRDVEEAEKADPGFEPRPRYWVAQGEVEARLRGKGWTRGWLLGWRDIARSTDERTVIATVFPRVGSGDTLLIEMPHPSDLALCAANFANLCALVLDFAARQKVGGTHLKYNVFKQLPILPPDFYTEARLAFVVPRVLELSCTSRSLEPFARELGYDGPPFRWDPDRRAFLRAELDAFFARAYGLSRDELRYVLDPKDVCGEDYPSETFRVLEENEIRRFGEYRTRRLVLEAWDRFEADGSFARLGLG